MKRSERKERPKQRNKGKLGREERPNARHKKKERKKERKQNERKKEEEKKQKHIIKKRMAINKYGATIGTLHLNMTLSRNIFNYSID